MHCDIVAEILKLQEHTPAHAHMGKKQRREGERELREGIWKGQLKLRAS